MVQKRYRMSYGSGGSTTLLGHDMCRLLWLSFAYSQLAYRNLSRWR
jgi:hypothetical protein